MKLCILEINNAYYFFRCKKVYDGVTHAGKLYPNAYLIMILIGTLKGLLQNILYIYIIYYNIYI